MCAEDLPFVTSTRADAAAGAASYIGQALLDALEAVCAEWPRGVMDPDFRAPFLSPAPALLLSGTDDPVTPPAEAERAARSFPDHRHIVLEGQGHGQLTAACIDRVMAAFLDAGTARGLDTSCTNRVRPLPFFTSLAGPEP
jgi:pimeloyl-ACP methyl ester carboxylesterase